jgi:hypothetical protein
MDAPLQSRWGTCTHHPAVEATGRCRDCARPTCSLCRFDLSTGRYCADCASRPVQTGTGAGKAQLSIGLAVLCVASFTGLMLWAATAGAAMSEREQMEFQIIDAIVTKGVTVMASAGVILGFISTDESRQNVLGVVGIVVNALLLLALTGLVVVAAIGAGVR